MIININKPKNWTSFDVVAKARGILGIKKIGHAGTLDPLATGVLVLLTDKDTKKQNEIMQYDKEYHADIAFGGMTDSYDLETSIQLVDKEIKIDKLKEFLPEIIKKFQGEIDQKAPAYSAKKVNGRRLYKYARKGKVPPEDIPVKRIEIFSINTLESYSRKFYLQSDSNIKLPVFKLQVTCSSGTYIRSLAYDLGHELGCGGFLSDLVRTRVGPYLLEEAITLNDLESQNILRDIN